MGQALTDGLEARGACGDQSRVPERLPCGLHGGACFLELRLISRPTCGRSAAAKNEPDSSGQRIAEVLVYRNNVLGRRRRELASREESGLAGRESRLVPCQEECFALAEGHVAQGKVVCGGWHLAAAHHALTSVETHVGHVQVLGTH